MTRSSTAVREIYRVEQLPVFQNRMFGSEAEAIECTRGDIVLVQDLQTGLIFNAAFDPAVMTYDADYQNEQACSAVFQSHLGDVAQIIQRQFGGMRLIEVGCGKGHFLERLVALGFDIAGFDPAYEGRNPRIVREYFGPGTGLQAEGVLLRHVLEHVRDPVAFLDQLHRSNGGGKIYIEVPCLDWICAHKAWFDIFYEHANYFRLGDLCAMFGTVYECGHTFGGQYLYVVADLSSLQAPVRAADDRFEMPADFLASIDHCAARYGGHGPVGDRIPAVWGAASKGVIFSLFARRRGIAVEMIVDINPAKQGKFIPGTGLRVSTPEECMLRIASGADVLVMNSNYLAEIQALTDNRFNYLLVEHGHI